MILYIASSVVQYSVISSLGITVGTFGKKYPWTVLMGTSVHQETTVWGKIKSGLVYLIVFLKNLVWGKNLDLIWFTYGLSCTCQKPVKHVVDVLWNCSEKIRGLRSTKSFSETLQNFLLYFCPYECPGLCKKKILTYVGVFVRLKYSKFWGILLEKIL